MLGVLAQQVSQAQGIVYLSNLGQTSTGGTTVGSDSWLATQFITGFNAGGYSLNSIQLAMADAVGDPGGFTATLYTFGGSLAGAQYPGVSLGDLNGSVNPATGGLYTYTPTSDLILSPNTSYFIVLAAGTAVAAGAYEWSVETTSSDNFSSSDDWAGFVSFESSAGSSWKTIGGSYPNFIVPQYAINATAIPEPGVLSLFGLGCVFLFGIFCRRRHQRIGSR